MITNSGFYHAALGIFESDSGRYTLAGSRTLHCLPNRHCGDKLFIDFNKQMPGIVCTDQGRGSLIL